MTKADETTQLLGGPLPRSDRASVRKTCANIIISIVGSGVLGLPFTYRISGWLVATCSVILAASLSYYCMILLVQCRDKLSSTGHEYIQTYPELGYHLYGKYGRQAIEITLLISQIGCCIAYLIFIGHNLSSVFFKDSRYITVILVMAALEIPLSYVRSLSTLAPLSIFGNICNAVAMAIVIKDDVHRFKGRPCEVKPYTNWQALPFALGVCIYCYEGFGMTLSLQSSMRKPHKFSRVLAFSFSLITVIYVVFGFAGYVAFGEDTQDIITLNLSNSDWTTDLVKLGLSTALFFTFPVMMYPVYEIIEGRCVSPSPMLSSLIRGLTVVMVALIAVAVPGFSTFISLVGSTVCALLAFVFPAVLHYGICGDDGRVMKGIDGILVVFGVVFTGFGTYQAVGDVFK